MKKCFEFSCLQSINQQKTRT